MGNNKRNKKKEIIWYVLSRDFRDNKIFLTTLEAPNQEKAWQIVEEEISTNMSQDWILTKEDVMKLKQLLEKVKCK